MLLLQHLQGRVKTLKIQISSKYLELSVPAGSEGTQKNPFSKLFEGTQQIFFCQQCLFQQISFGAVRSAASLPFI